MSSLENHSSTPFAPLWKLAWRDGFVLWLSLAALMFSFHWFYVWIASQFDPSFLQNAFNGLPEIAKRIIPVAIEQMMKPEGRMAVAYDHPLVVFGCVAWAITRSSDAVSGPLGRGTLELILAQPVSRWKVLLANAFSTTIGLFGLVLLGWLGDWAGVQTVSAFANVPIGQFGWVALNLFCFVFFIGGVTTLLSACDRQRWRTIGLMVALFVLAMLFKVLAMGVPDLSWLKYFTFFSWYEAQKLIQSGTEIAELSLKLDAPLLVLGIVAYILAGVVFTRRDLPAPL